MSSIPFSGVAAVLVRVDGLLTPRGTAFLISSRHALTALHVVDEAGEEVILRFVTARGTTNICARELSELRDQRHDSAILRCEEPPPPDAVPIELCASMAPGLEWETKGYPKGRDEDGFTLGGNIRDPHATDRGVRAIQLHASELNTGEDAAGFSGAPCIVGGRAIGFIRTAFSLIKGKTSAGTLYATSIADVSRTLLPRLRAGDHVELQELRKRLKAVRAPRAAIRVLHGALVASIFAAMVALSVTRVHLRFVDQDRRGEPRLPVELRDCLRTVSGTTDNFGEVHFTMFRWCPTYRMIVERYGSRSDRSSLSNEDFLESQEMRCTIVDSQEVECR